jgi:hypothetical protein
MHSAEKRLGIFSFAAERKQNEIYQKIILEVGRNRDSGNIDT